MPGLINIILNFVDSFDAATKVQKTLVDVTGLKHLLASTSSFSLPFTPSQINKVQVTFISLSLSLKTKLEYQLKYCVGSTAILIQKSVCQLPVL